MPCREDWDGTTDREVYCKNVARVFLYVANSVGYQIPDQVRTEAVSSHASEDYTVPLCALVKTLDVKERNRLFNSRTEDAVRFHAWWNKHILKDRMR